MPPRKALVTVVFSHGNAGSETIPSCAQAGVLGTVPGLLGTLQAHEAPQADSGDWGAVDRDAAHGRWADHAVSKTALAA